jgi:hypothetical protein
MSRPPHGLFRARAILPLALSFLVALLALAAPSSPSTRLSPRSVHVAASARANPLIAPRWGTFSGTGGWTWDPVYQAYLQSTGQRRMMLKRIATRPLVHWFGPWVPVDKITTLTREYIDTMTQNGKYPDTLVQIAAFGMKPWEGAACGHTFTSTELTHYRNWINGLARGIGSAHVAMILQPDLPFATCSAHEATPLAAVNYAARRFSQLSNTTTYIDVGAADWPSVDRAVHLLRAAGVRYTRGFALDATHYDSIVHQVGFGAEVANGLYRAGLKNKHFVISTAQNGRPFGYHQYHGPDFNRAATCRSRTDRRCATLGIPPTTNVADSRLNLPAHTASTARRLVDAYLWIGRPWVNDRDFKLDLNRALALARTTPFG